MPDNLLPNYEPSPKKGYFIDPTRHLARRQWLGRKPLRLISLKGRVALVDMWTFG
jgi:hypothetical protein